MRQSNCVGHKSSSRHYVLALPTIDETCLQDITVKVGETIQYNVPISGEPPPSAHWTTKQSTVRTGERFSVDNSEKVARLKIDNAERGDSGVITLTLKNTVGAVTSSANVLVVGEFL